MKNVFYEKMQGKSWAAVFVLLLLLTSCAHSQKNVESDRHSSFVTIPVRFDDSVKEGMKLSDFVEKIEFVPLELTDECLLRGVDHAEVTEDYIYVVDKPDYRSPCVYQFDRQGRFLRKIGAQGEGPEEFIEMRGFTLNQETGEISVYDGVRNRLVSYLPDGIFSRVIDMHQDCDNFEFQDGLFYLYNPYSDKNEGKKLAVLNMKGERLSQYLEKLNLGVVFGNSRVVKTTENEVLFYEAFNDTVYSFDKEKLKTKYVFDFGQYTMPYAKKREYMESVAQNKPLEYQLQLLGDYIPNGSDIQETKKWLFFNVVKGLVLYRGIYDKETKTTRIQGSYMDDLYETIGLGDEFIGVTSGRLIASVNANRVKNAFEKYLPKNVSKGELSLSRLDSLTAFFSRYIPIDRKLQQKNMGSTQERSPKNLSDVLDDMYGSSGEELNPMLMIIQFKE